MKLEAIKKDVLDLEDWLINRHWDVQGEYSNIITDALSDIQNIERQTLQTLLDVAQAHKDEAQLWADNKMTTIMGRHLPSSPEHREKARYEINIIRRTIAAIKRQIAAL